MSMLLRQIQLSESLEGIARLGVVFFKSLTNSAAAAQGSSAKSDVVWARLSGLATELKHSIGDRRPSEIDAVARTRKLYRLVGIDPTKDRPSSEKLLRRAVRGKPLPRVNTLVDAMNLVSLQLQCPLGVYDWDRIVPPVIVRIGRPDEGYEGISGDPLRLDGRLVLGDGEGLFGNPSHDSSRTRVTESTVRALIVAWAPAEAPNSFLESVLSEITQVAEEFCDAKVAEQGIF